MQSLYYKNKKICIFHSRDYNLFTEIYYLCTEFEKRHKISKNF